MLNTHWQELHTPGSRRLLGVAGLAGAGSKLVVLGPAGAGSSVSLAEAGEALWFSDEGKDGPRRSQRAFPTPISCDPEARAPFGQDARCKCSLGLLMTRLFVCSSSARAGGIDGVRCPRALLSHSLAVLAAVPDGDFPFSGFPPAPGTALHTPAPRAGGNGRHFRLERAWNSLEIVPAHGRGVGSQFFSSLHTHSMISGFGARVKLKTSFVFPAPDVRLVLGAGMRKQVLTWPL